MYVMTHSPRGRAIILNNSTFAKRDERTGSEYDVENLSRAFTQLDFTVTVWSDLTSKVIHFLQRSHYLYVIIKCLVVSEDHIYVTLYMYIYFITW